MKGIASACGSATVVNAISTGKGAAFAIDLRVRAEVELKEGGKDINGKISETSEDSLLVEKCVEKVLKFKGVRDQYGAKVKTTTDLPIAVGLSSSSAAANATVLATTFALGDDIQPEKAINLGIEAAFDTGTTITGAYDDAAASFYGGGVVTNNLERSLLEEFSVDPELVVSIYLPSEKFYTSDTDVEKTKMISELVDLAHEEALDGNVFGAQTLNGLLYSSILGFNPRPAIRAIEVGALSAGLTGTGPAIVAISKEGTVERIKDIWKEDATDIIVTGLSGTGAREENE